MKSAIIVTWRLIWILPYTVAWIVANGLAWIMYGSARQPDQPVLTQPAGHREDGLRTVPLRRMR